MTELHAKAPHKGARWAPVGYYRDPADVPDAVKRWESRGYEVRQVTP